MTKSRTLRKAAAVALSLAMAFSVAGTTPAFAAKAKVKATKITVSPKSATIKVDASKKITVKLNKASKKNVAVKLVSSDSAVAKVASKVTVKKNKKSAKFSVKGLANGTATITAKFKKANGKWASAKVSVNVVKDEDADVAVSVTLADDLALQSDGTGRTGDILTASYGSALGTPKEITWYCDEKVVGSEVATGMGITAMLKAGGQNRVSTSAKGSYYVVIKNEAGKEYTSNKVTLSDTEAAAKFESTTIEDEYSFHTTSAAGVNPPTKVSNLSFATVDAKGILTVKMNRNYAGTVKIYKADAAKGASAEDSFDTDTTTISPAAFATAAATNKSILVKELPTNDAFLNAAAAVNTAVGNVAGNGNVTYKFYSNKLVRGTKYKVVFAQKNVKDTDVGGASEIKSEELTAPYLTAPASIKFKKAVPGVAPEIEFDGEDGKAISWLGDASGAVATPITSANVQFKSAMVYYADKKIAAAKDATGNISAAGNLVAGVLTGGVIVPATGADYNIGEVVLNKGVYGPDEITLSTAVSEKMGSGYTAMTLSVAEATATNAKVSFTSLTTNGTVSIVRGVADEAAAIAAVESNDTSKVKGSKAVEKGDPSVVIEGAVSGLEDVTTNANANKFYAVFVPTDKALFISTSTGAQTLVQKVSKYALAAGYTTSTTICTGTATTAVAGYYDNTQYTTNVLEAKDQFGNTMKVAATDGKQYTGRGADDSQNGDPTLTISGNDANGKATIALAFANCKAGETYTFKLSSGQTFTIKVKALSADDNTKLQAGAANYTGTTGDLAVTYSLS